MPWKHSFYNPRNSWTKRYWEERVQKTVEFETVWPANRMAYIPTFSSQFIKKVVWLIAVTVRKRQLSQGNEWNTNFCCSRAAEHWFNYIKYQDAMTYPQNCDSALIWSSGQGKNLLHSSYLPTGADICAALLLSKHLLLPVIWNNICCTKCSESLLKLHITCSYMDTAGLSQFIVILLRTDST